MRLHNSAASSTATGPLRYPIGLPLGPPVPLTRQSLFQMTGKFPSLDPVHFINIL